MVTLSGLAYGLSSMVTLWLLYISSLCLLYTVSLLAFSLWPTLYHTLPPISSPLPFPPVYRRYRYAIRLTRNGDYFV